MSGKVVTGKCLKAKLAQAERQIEAKGWTVMGVSSDPDDRYYRVTWHEPEDPLDTLAKAIISMEPYAPAKEQATE